VTIWRAPRERIPTVTRAEIRLHGAMGRAGLRFLSQVHIAGKDGRHWLVDFEVFGDRRSVVVEVDGETHNYLNRQIKDALKDKDLTELGYPVLRFPDRQVYRNLTEVVATIKRTVEECNR
jgi:very-short-patch-repair endonuclease